MTSQPARRGRPSGLWANSDFVKLWTGQTVSKFGTHITGAAMAATAVLVLQATPAQMGLLGAIGGLPVLLFSLLAGVWVDRLRRRPILIAADLGRAFILLSVPIAMLAGVLSMQQLYLVAGLVSVFTVFYSVADQSFLPAVVKKEQLVEANARIGSSDSLAEIAGPSLGGILVQWLSAPYAIFVDAGSYFFSAGCLEAIRTPEPAPERHEHPNMWREMIAGLRTILNQPILRALMGTTATFNFFGNFIGTIYWLFLVRDLGLPPAVVGVSIGVGGVGALIGTLVAERITRRFGVGRALIGALLLGNVWSALLFLPLASWPVSIVSGVIFTMQLLGDIFWPVYFINVISLRQTVIPANILGRASASLDFVGEGAAPIGALVGGALATVIGARWTWLVGAAGILAGSLWLILSPVRGLKTFHEHQTPIRMNGGKG
jgi:predicted MFS family arabinose efflux permease